MSSAQPRVYGMGNNLYLNGQSWEGGIDGNYFKDYYTLKI